MEPLPFDAGLDRYEAQAAELPAAHRTIDDARLALKPEIEKYLRSVEAKPAADPGA